MAHALRRLLILVLPLAASEIRAQAAPAGEPVRIWVHAGVGFGGGGFAAAAGADLGIRSHLVSIRAAATAELFGDDFNDVAILYGRSLRWDRGMVAVSTGLSLVEGLRCEGLLGGCTETPARFGVPLAVRVGFYPFRFFGAGIYGFGNINGEQPFAGVALTLEVGRLR